MCVREAMRVASGINGPKKTGLRNNYLLLLTVAVTRRPAAQGHAASDECDGFENLPGDLKG